MSESSNNGHTELEDEEGFGAEAYQRLTATGNRANRHAGSYTNGDGAAARPAEGKKPPRNVERHPEDPPGAYQGAAEEVCDPEQIRRYANWFGKASQAIDPEWFEWLVRPLYRCVHDVRVGAITIPARRETGQQLKMAATTEAAIAEIKDEGTADGEKADRLQTAVISRVEGELTRSEAKEQVAEGQAVVAREDVSRVRASETERQTRMEDEPRRSWRSQWRREVGANLFSRLSIEGWKAGLVFGLETAGTAYLLAPNVADLVGVNIWEGAAISAVISLALLAAAFAAGMGLAAVRLPGWLVGISIAAAFGAILVKFIPALDALRLNEDAGVETLTAATLAAFLIAMVSGYAMATAGDQRRTGEAEDEETELLKKAGTPLSEVLEVLDNKKAKLTEAEEDRGRLEDLLAALWEKVEDLRDSAARAGAAAERRRQEGIEAEVEVEMIRAVAEAGIEQEEAAAEWAYLIALAAQEKARVEKLPEVPDTPPPALHSQVVVSSGPSGPSLLQLLALGAASAGAIASLFLGVVPLGIAIPVAALLVLLDRQVEGRRRRKAEDQGAPLPLQRPRIVAPAGADNPLYVHQPDHMVPKYGDGGAGAGERQ